jgi:glucosylglycerate synthase
MEDSIPKQARERIEQIGKADLVVGILASGKGGTGAPLAMVREALGTLSTPPLTVVAHSDGAQTTEADIPLVPLFDPVLEADAISQVQRVTGAYQSIFAAGEKLGVRACCVIASDLQTVTSRWISLLAQPVLEMGFDLVAPCYGHHKFEGLLNWGIISPLHRALYGQRIQNPMGPDLGFSSRILQRMLGTDHGTRAARDGPHPLASLATTAINASLPVCQACLGTRIYPPTDWTDVSSLLAQILGPVFADLERNAPFWQKTRGSHSVPGFGEPGPLPEDRGPFDPRRMIESFRLGIRNLHEIWGLVLPPTTLLELKKLSLLAQEQFRMHDLLWARIVYDFALAYRLRTISRDHLLRAMTGLYLGWVASWALELKDAGAAAVEQRFEGLCLAYETAKPYFVSRWRWPDRFNP